MADQKKRVALEDLEPSKLLRQKPDGTWEPNPEACAAASAAIREALRRFMRGVPVLASGSGYHPRSGMLPLARSSGRSNYALNLRK